MHYSADRAIQLPQLFDDVALAIAAVDHDGKVALMSQAKMPIEPLLLVRKRRSLPVSIEAGLTDGDNARATDKVGDQWPVVLAGFGRVVGMDTHRCEQATVGLGKLHRGRTR